MGRGPTYKPRVLVKDPELKRKTWGCRLQPRLINRINAHMKRKRITVTDWFEEIIERECKPDA